MNDRRNAPDVDISIPDLMDVIDQFAEVRAEYVKTAQGADRAFSLRRNVEQILNQEKAARQAEALKERVRIVAEIRRHADSLRYGTNNGVAGEALRAIVNSVADRINTLG